MKRLVLVFAIILCLSISLSAQIRIIRGGDNTSSSAYMGIYPSDLSLEYIKASAYPYQHGVVVSGVVNGAPAERAGLQANDIIMQMDGVQVNDREVFSDLMDAKTAGQSVDMLIWRNGSEMPFNMVLGSLADNAATEISTERRKSLGYGGGSWIPALYFQEMDDVNALYRQMGFSDVVDEPVLIQGGAGKGYVGKGIMLGGIGMGYSVIRTINDPDPAFAGYKTSARYNLGMGGFTIDKRFHLAGSLYGSMGMMIGAADQSMEITHTNGDFNWADINGTALQSGNTTVRLSREYLMLQPRAELIYRLLPWLALRAEAAYNYGASFEKGWKVDIGDGNTYDIQNSPNTALQGFQFSVGPWFGF